MSFLSDDINELKDDVAVKSTESKPKKKIYKVFDYDELVHMVKKLSLDGYDEFSKESYPYSLNFYDFEVFMGDWLVVIINPVDKIKTIIVNDEDALAEYHRKHKNQVWVGYNSRNYDTHIFRAILSGMNPKRVNDDIIYNDARYSSFDFDDIQLYDFDIMTSSNSLKQLEGFMGNDMRETSVPFDIDRPLTKSEILDSIKYCMHDVEQTIEVFKERKSEYDSQVELIHMFKLPLSMISLTQAQLVANILECKRTDGRQDEEFDLEFVDSLRIEKYKRAVEWFKNPKNRHYAKDNNLVMDVCGIPHTFGWGGIHGCPDKPVHYKGKIFHVDVTSYYPSIMIEYDFLTRNCKNKKKFKEIYDKRVELKKAGKKKEQAPYKIILNGTYGICKNKNSKAYDPKQANNICVNGQLMLVDLLEHLEPYATIIQSNTDGIILMVKDDKAEAKMREVCQEWMNRTRMGLGFDEIDEIWQKDVNNYVFRFTNGKLERKGLYVKELNRLDNDLPIVNEAVLKYLTEDILPEDTVNNCNELIKFQKIVRVSSNYKMAWHNEKYLKDKTFRVFASKNVHDTYIGKVKYEGATIERFAETPVRCFIDNSDVKNKQVPDNLDKKWYIDLANKRIKDYGVSLDDDNWLF